MMSELAKALKAEYRRQYMQKPENRLKATYYQRKWRKENPEKVKVYNESYWERRAAKMAAGNSDNI